MTSKNSIARIAEVLDQIDQLAADDSIGDALREATDELRGLTGVRPPHFLIFVYYSRAHRASWGFEGPSSEPWDSTSSLSTALRKAKSASRKHPEHEFAVEGDLWETGGWDNPLFKAGERIR